MKKALTSFLVLGLSSPFTIAGQTDFGTSGLIKMPDASMEADGTLAVTIAVDEAANLYNITFQALPSVQATFRYSIFNPTDKPNSRDKLRDRSYEIKSQIVQESSFLPSIALGVRDILGTGAWEGEYLVATKSIAGADLTLGVGWGRLGERASFRNPLHLVDDDFDVRPKGADVGGTFGGKSRGTSFFRGPAALFGGVSYKLKSLPLTLIAEIESDKYSREVTKGTIHDPSGYNVGLSWAPLENTSLRLSWLRGDTLGLTISGIIDAKKSQPQKRPRTTMVSSLPKSLPNARRASWYDKIVYEGAAVGLSIKKGRLLPASSKASLVVENQGFNMTADAIATTAAFSEVFLPKRVSEVDIHLEEAGFVGPTINYTLQREAAAEGNKRRVQRTDLPKIRRPQKMPEATNLTGYGYPSLGLGFDLSARVQLMDPDDPIRKQLYAKLSASFMLSPSTTVWARYEQNLYNDFSTSREPDSNLPNVRTLVNKYLVEGSSGIEQLYIENRSSISPSVHLRLYAGILESMYGGLGGEVLYAPYRQRWALGFNLNGVAQRSVKRDFDFREYKAATGHFSAYYASPFYNLDAALHVGQYLAKDRGYTFELRRTFDNGFAVGGFFTRTNVSAEDFGEGSFDKGLYFRIPFNGFLPGNTKGAYQTTIRSLERDGGRRLEGFGGSIWFDRRAIRYDAIDRNLGRLF